MMVLVSGAEDSGFALSMAKVERELVLLMAKRGNVP